MMMEIILDNLKDNSVVKLLQDHLADMHATSPAESIHALEITAIKNPSLTFWRAQEQDLVLGCIALKELNDNHAEIKSMRTDIKARNKGVGSQLLSHVIKIAEERNYKRLSLETGTMDFFKPAIHLYKKYGFQFCQPFGSYKKDPNSCFMTRQIITQSSQMKRY